MSGISLNRWYLAQLKPNGFQKAVANLARQNFTTFMPMQIKSVRHARKLSSVERPVFPGYIFILLGEDQGDWRKINSTTGVARLVSFHANQPAPVPDALIDALQRRCDVAGILLPPSDLQQGESVTVSDGAFADFTGTIEKILSGDRIRILFEFMGQETRVDVATEKIERSAVV